MTMVVWDFDNTITRYHTSVGAMIHNPNDVVKDQELFVKTINLLMKLNKKIAIASYGYKSIILSVMKRLFGENNPFTDANVITPKDISSQWLEGHAPPPHYNKNFMLNLLGQRYQCKSQEILLIDDSWPNIIDAKNADFCTMHLPNGYHRYVSTDLIGMTDESIEEFFNKSITIPCK